MGSIWDVLFDRADQLKPFVPLPGAPPLDPKDRRVLAWEWRVAQRPQGSTPGTGNYGLDDPTARDFLARQWLTRGDPGKAAQFSSTPMGVEQAAAIAQQAAALQRSKRGQIIGRQVGTLAAAAAVGFGISRLGSGAAGAIPDSVKVTPPVPLGGRMGLFDWLGSRAQQGFPILSGLFGRQQYPQYPMMPGYFPQALPGSGYQYGLPVPSQSAYTPPAQNLTGFAGATPISYGMQATPAMTMLPTLPQLGAMAGAGARLAGTGLSALRAGLPKISRSDALSVGAIISGGIAWLNGSPVGKVRRRRRVNPLNYRAAKRAARRLCMVQDLCGDITAALPARKARAPRARRSFGRRRKKRCA